MKCTLLLIVSLLASITMQAQEYFPTGMKWEEVNVDPSMELDYDNAHIFEIGADTLIGNVTYKKVLKDNVFSGICVRESGDKVWLLTKEYPTEFLLYDFDWDGKKEVETQYLKGRNIEGNDYDLQKETIPMDKCQDVTINGKTYQYYRDSFVRSQIRGIGKVAELNRYPCLLGYKEMEVISPGMTYFKVHWIQRNGEETFRSDYAKEWTTEVPGGSETEINKQFTAETEEGVMLTYTVISESEKTCMVGEEYHWPVPTARSNRVLKVRGSQPSGDITIPEVANGYNVIRIEAFAFENSAITNVVIPNSVKTIGVAAFSGCVDLKSVILPNQLSTIEGDTFSGCESLSNINIPESVISIGDYAFGGCKQLKEVVIPSSVTHFGESVFWNTGFTSLPKLPGDLTTIPNGMFYQCTQLTSIEIPQNITRIGDTAFGRCPISEIEIPASVTYIGVAAFANCKNLTKIVIPDNVTDIGFNAFNGCSNLKTVTLSKNIGGIREGSFNECTRLESIVIPNGVKFIGKQAFASCSSLSSIDIPETVEEIGEQAFTDCSSLTQLFIPKSVVNFKINKDDNWWQYSYRSFIYGCNSLTSLVVDKDNPVYDSRNNCNAIIETVSNTLIVGCTATMIPEGITAIGLRAFDGFQNLTSITLPRSLNIIELGAFNGSGLHEISIPENVTSIGDYAFSNCTNLTGFNCYAENVPNAESNIFYNTNIKDITLRVPAASVSAYQAVEPWKNFKEIVALTPQMAYRPFVEDDKVWKVGNIPSGYPVQWVEYLYFDGDTIVDGKTCKQMMRQRYINPDFAESHNISQGNSLSYVGAWYEENKKVYEYDTTDKQFKLMYDFSVEANDTIEINNRLYVIGPKQTGGKEGFKGVYRNVRLWEDGVSYYSVPWLEGVGGTDRPTNNVYPGVVDPMWFLMECYVGDEVIYLNGAEDGATPAEARKQRIDFTHTTKVNPKTRSEEEQSLYGEYNEQLLRINLDPINDAYMVSITDESGKTVYEKAINAGSIVGLNIDISKYAKGHYTVIVENSNESFIGVFNAQTTGIEEVKSKKSEIRGYIYNLQGQRLSSLQKGLNIVNGKKVYVK